MGVRRCSDPEIMCALAQRMAEGGVDLLLGRPLWASVVNQMHSAIMLEMDENDGRVLPGGVSAEAMKKAMDDPLVCENMLRIWLVGGTLIFAEALRRKGGELG